MQVTFFQNFNKRNNSTKIPSGGVTYNVVLKDGTSLDRPTFLIDGIDLNYNYCYAFNRYYFITNIILSNNNIYAIECDTDVLATFRNNVLNYTCFVERAASSYDSMIQDNLLSEKLSVANIGAKYIGPVVSTTHGTYLVRILGKTGLRTYTFNKTTFEVVAEQILNLGNINDAMMSYNSFAASLSANPSQYIESIIWVPFSITGDNSGEITVGPITVLGGTNYNYLSGAQLASGKEVAYTLPTFSRYFNDWRDYDSRFTKINLYIPACGTVEIDPRYFEANPSMNCNYTVDVNTGSCTAFIHTGESGNVIATLSGVLGMTLDAASVKENVAGIAGGIVGGLVSAAMGNVIGAVGGVVEAVGAAALPNISKTGNVSGLPAAIAFPNITMQVIRFNSAEYATSNAGRPLMRNVRLGSLSGYVKCGNASLSIGGFESDKIAINNLLNTGVYIE